MIRSIEFVFLLPAMLAGFVWEAITTGFRAGRFLYSTVMR